MALGWLVFVAAALVAALFYVPFHRWTFVHEGRRIDVLNYGLTESVAVDGARVRRTRVGGDYLTYARHALPSDSGEPLVIDFLPARFTVRCVARVGSRTVFDSTAHPEVVVEDPRWTEARVALDELRARPETAASAATLRRVLEAGFRDLADARRLAEASGGQRGDAVEELVALREGRVDEALALLRELRTTADAARRAARSGPRRAVEREG